MDSGPTVPIEPIPDENPERKVLWLRQFLRMLAHELAGPLTPLSGHIQLLATTGRENLTTLQARSVESLNRVSARLLRFHEAVLEVARLERGAVGTTWSEEDPVDLLGRTAALFENDARQMGIDLHVEPPPEPFHVVTDPRLVCSLVGHLVRNAIGFTPSGATVLLKATQPEDDWFQIVVEDQGTGIKDNELDIIFNPFVKLSRSDYDVEGPGLGLTAAALIAHTLGGTIHAERANPGLRVIMTLPAAPDDPAQDGGEQGEAEQPSYGPDGNPAQAKNES